MESETNKIDQMTETLDVKAQEKNNHECFDGEHGQPGHVPGTEDNKNAADSNARDSTKEIKDPQLSADDITTQIATSNKEHKDHHSDDGNNIITEQNIDNISVMSMKETVTDTSDNSFGDKIMSSETETNQKENISNSVDNQTKEENFIVTCQNLEGTENTDMDNVANGSSMETSESDKSMKELNESDNIGMEYHGEKILSSEPEANQKENITDFVDNQKEKENFVVTGQNLVESENTGNVAEGPSMETSTKNTEEPNESDNIGMKYRNMCVQYDSSSGDSEEDSSGSSSSSSSDYESDSAEQDKPQSELITTKAEIDDDDSDDDKRDRPVEGPPRTKGEITFENLPPIEELTIKVEDSVVLQEVGHVVSIIGTLVIVQANRSLPALNENSILFLDGRRVLGQIFEVFGPVPAPLYSIRFNSINDINEKQIIKDQPVFYAPQEEWLTNYVFVEQLRRMRGTDASWEHNNEPPERYVDFSDDEEERKAKAKRRGRNTEGKVEEGQHENQSKKKKTRKEEPPNNQASGQQWNRKKGGRGPYSTAPFNRNPFDHMHHGPPSVPDPCMPRGTGFPGYRGPPFGFRNRGPHPPRFGQFPAWGPRYGRSFQMPRGLPPGFVGPRSNGPVYRNGPPEYYGPEMGTYGIDNRQNAGYVSHSADDNQYGSTSATLSSEPVIDTRFMNNPG